MTYPDSSRVANQPSVMNNTYPTSADITAITSTSMSIMIASISNYTRVPIRASTSIVTRAAKASCG